MGNSNSDLINSQINDLFLDCIDHLSQIIGNEGSTCITLIETAQKKFNEKTDIDKISGDYFVPIIKSLNRPSSAYGQTEHHTAVIKAVKKISHLIDKYVRIRDGNSHIRVSQKEYRSPNNSFQNASQSSVTCDPVIEL